MPSQPPAGRRPDSVDWQAAVEQLLASSRGHFILESGHHGELWLDLELLCRRPERIRPLARELARRLAGLDLDAVCGPLNEGAFVALQVAEELGVDFVYAERVERTAHTGLYPVLYQIPTALRQAIHGRRVAIVNDVINAGSAVGGTFADLRTCGATTIAVAPLLVLGTWTSTFAAENQLEVHALAELPNPIWTPAECPLCKAGVPIENVRSIVGP